MGIEGELVELVRCDEPLGLQHIVVELSLDLAKSHHRRLIISELEQPPQQHGGERQRCAVPLGNAAECMVREVGVGACEVEQEFNIG